MEDWVYTYAVVSLTTIMNVLVLWLVIIVVKCFMVELKSSKKKDVSTVGER